MQDMGKDWFIYGFSNKYCFVYKKKVFTGREGWGDEDVNKVGETCKRYILLTPPHFAIQVLLQHEPVCSTDWNM